MYLYSLEEVRLERTINSQKRAGNLERSERDGKGPTLSSSGRYSDEGDLHPPTKVASMELKSGSLLMTALAS